MSDSEGNDRGLKWMRAEVLSAEQKVMYDLVNPRYNVRRLCADAPKVSTHAPASIPARALRSLFTDIRTIPCVEIQLEETVVSGTRSRMFILVSPIIHLVKRPQYPFSQWGHSHQT